MTILENPVFKYRRVLNQKIESENTRIKFTFEIWNALNSFPIKPEEEVIKPIEEISFRPEISEWIKCQYRMRQVIDHEVISFCINPFHPGFQANMFAVYCMKKECDLNKITDETLFF